MEMKEFSFKKLGGTLKKKPVLAIGGVVLAGGLIYLFSRRGGESSSWVEYGAGDLTESASDGGGSGGGEIDLIGLEEELLSKLFEASDSRFEEFETNQEKYLTSIFSGLESQIVAYVSQFQRVDTPIQTQQPTNLQPLNTNYNLDNIALIEGSKALTFSPGVSYSPGQVDVIAGWVVEDNKAISGGAMGTSKNPAGLAGSGMTVTYSDDKVSFNPKSTPTPASQVVKTESRVIGGDTYTVKAGTRANWSPGQAY